MYFLYCWRYFVFPKLIMLTADKLDNVLALCSIVLVAMVMCGCSRVTVGAIIIVYVMVVLLWTKSVLKEHRKGVSCHHKLATTQGDRNEGKQVACEYLID